MFKNYSSNVNVKKREGEWLKRNGYSVCVCVHVLQDRERERARRQRAILLTLSQVRVGF